MSKCFGEGWPNRNLLSNSTISMRNQQGTSLLYLLPLLFELHHISPQLLPPSQFCHFIQYLFLFSVFYFPTPSIITWVAPLSTHFLHSMLCFLLALLSPLASLCFPYNSHLYFKRSPFYLGSNLSKYLLKSFSLCLALCYWSSLQCAPLLALLPDLKKNNSCSKTLNV